MLHILLLILKIIGIILAVILGILVLLAGILLFVPIRYEGAARCEGSRDTFRAKGKATWLFHFIRAEGYYRNGKAGWRLRIAWKKYGKKTKGRPEEEERVSHEYPEKREKPETTEEAEKPETVKTAEKDEAVETVEEIEATEAVEEIEAAEENEEGEDVPETEESPEPEPAHAEEAKTQIHKTSRRKEKSLWEKIKAWFHKIKCTFSGFCDKIRLLGEKKDKILQFLESETHKAAWKRLKKETVRLLGGLKPKDGALQVVYGFEDPCTTGQVLAGLSMIYPFIGSYTEIRPDFERSVLEGKARVKGKARLWHVAVFAWNLFWNRDVRETYRDIKEFEL